MSSRVNTLSEAEAWRSRLRHVHGELVESIAPIDPGSSGARSQRSAPSEQWQRCNWRIFALPAARRRAPTDERRNYPARSNKRQAEKTGRTDSAGEAARCNRTTRLLDQLEINTIRPSRKQKAKNMSNNNPEYVYSDEEREQDRRAEARAEARLKVQLDATKAQRPDLYNKAIAMPALDATRIRLERAWRDNLAEWFRQLLNECEDKADDKAEDALRAFKGYMSPGTYDRIYYGTYAKWLPRLLARALKTHERLDPRRVGFAIWGGATVVLKNRKTDLGVETAKTRREMRRRDGYIPKSFMHNVIAAPSGAIITSSGIEAWLKLAYGFYRRGGGREDDDLSDLCIYYADVLESDGWVAHMQLDSGEHAWLRTDKPDRSQKEDTAICDTHWGRLHGKRRLIERIYNERIAALQCHEGEKLQRGEWSTPDDRWRSVKNYWLLPGCPAHLRHERGQP